MYVTRLLLNRQHVPYIALNVNYQCDNENVTKIL